MEIIKEQLAVSIPTYGSEGSAGMDLYAAMLTSVELSFGERILISTGVKVAIPEGYCGMITSRSGLAKDNGIVVLNAPAIIDSDYRGTVKVIIVNTTTTKYLIRRGIRIAQMIIVPYVKVELEEVSEFSTNTVRGEGGFGSTGE